MSINVYWSCLEDEWMLAKEPESISYSFYKKKHYDDKNNYFALNRCPAFNDFIKNYFSIKSIYDYSFTINVLKNEKIITTNDFDQLFFDKHFKIRSMEHNCFSFIQNYIFFTDADSLETEFYHMPFLDEKNSILESCILIPGKYDIGKWYRAVEFPFFLKNTHNKFSINRGQNLYYVKFNTNQKINFIQYRSNDTLKEMEQDGFSLNRRGMNISTMKNYYNSFKNKKRILKEIKNNLI